VPGVSLKSALPKSASWKIKEKEEKWGKNFPHLTHPARMKESEKKKTHPGVYRLHCGKSGCWSKKKNVKGSPAPVVVTLNTEKPGTTGGNKATHQ